MLCGLLCFSSGCTPEGTGTLTINLTDEPGDYEEVHITVSQISVHRGEEEEATEERVKDSEENANDGNWIIISEVKQGYNLLDFQDGAFSSLVEADLEAGVYTQIRLKIVEGDDETYVRLESEEGEGNKYPLKVPSGAKSGLKLIHPFEIVAGEETTLYLDFDAKESVIQTGNGQYKLKPTIKVLNTLPQSQGIKGHVYAVVASTSEEQPVSVIGAMVSAYQDGSKIESDETDENGYFALSLPVGIYRLEVIAGGYNSHEEDEVYVESGVWVEKEINLNPTS